MFISEVNNMRSFVLRAVFDIPSKKKHMMLVFEVNFDIFQEKLNWRGLDCLLQHFHHWD
jgi:hypothetical protein